MSKQLVPDIARIIPDLLCLDAREEKEIKEILIFQYALLRHPKAAKPRQSHTIS